MISEQVNTVVDKWFGDSFHHGPVAAQTEAYNQMILALPALKAALGYILTSAATLNPAVAATLSELEEELQSAKSA